MKFSDFFWPDSSLEQIRICYDAAELTIWNRSMNCNVTARCEGFIGMTDLCIWDDQIILQAECRKVPWDSGCLLPSPSVQSGNFISASVRRP